MIRQYFARLAITESMAAVAKLPDFETWLKPSFKASSDSHPKFRNGYPTDAVLKYRHQQAYRSRLNQASHDNHDNFKLCTTFQGMI